MQDYFTKQIASAKNVHKDTLAITNNLISAKAEFFL